MNLPNNVIPIKRVVLSPSTGDWCRLPYSGHADGCPNYGKKAMCPPNAPRFDEFFDLSAPLYLVTEEFNLGFYARRMAAKHPKWSQRQCRCCLYWQGGVRHALTARTMDLVGHLTLTTGAHHTYTMCPEAMGLNVFATARLAGLKMDKTRRISIDRHIAVVGKRRGERL